jgi:phosphatidylserine/phosphatidylglycerophosphate/cardiolipin synthase-like enzyme
MVIVAHRVESAEVVDATITDAVAKRGDSRWLRVRALGPSDNFPHLKLLTSDGCAAYVGSANLTWAALVHNVELGVLVDGASVAALEQLFDLMVESAAGA